ncbi:MAG: pyrroloquinoline quinone-dependent dehydrogenase, partial [Gammaproteobacteria bacterium]
MQRLPGLIFILIFCHGVNAAEGGWLYYGGDQGGRHYSGAAQINTSNISNLQVAWVYRSGDMEKFGDELKNTSGQSTPILLPDAAGGSLVYCTPFNRIIALNPGNGTQRWQFDPQI